MKQNKDITECLQAIAVFLIRFSPNKTKTDGIPEYLFIKEAYSKFEKSKTKIQRFSEFLLEIKDFDFPVKHKDAILALFHVVSVEDSLQKILLRKFTLVKENGYLIRKEDLIKNNLFHAKDGIYGKSYN